MSDELWIHNPSATDNEEYMYEILELFLFVPVSTLSERVCDDLKRRWEKEPITYHFRRFAINRWNIPYSNDCTSHSFFSGENPTRVYMCIAKTEDLVGNQKTTPYLFARKWEFPVNFSEISHRHMQSPNWLQGLIQNSLADQLREIRELIPLAVLRATQETGGQRNTRSRGRGTSGRGRGAPARAQGGIQGVAAAASGLVGRLLNQNAEQVSLLSDVGDVEGAENEADAEAAPSAQSTSSAPSAPSVAGSFSSSRSNQSRRRNVNAGTTDTLFLTKCQLQLNSSDLGNFFNFYIYYYIYLSASLVI